MEDNKNVFCHDCKGTGINKEQTGKCQSCSYIPFHLSVKKLKEVLATLPDDYVVCMSADVPNGYVVGGTHYKVDPMSKTIFIIDITSAPDKDDTAF